jgi:UDP-glucose 4-epimerase
VALVTGGAGFIGSHLVAALIARGLSVRVLDDLSVGTRERVPQGARLLVGDLRDRAVLAEALAGVEVVFHLAGRVTIRGSADDFIGDFEVNLGGMVALLDALRGTRVTKLVFASSMAVYAESDDARPVAESHPTEPRSPYGAAKLAAEHYARLVCGRLGIAQVSLRYFNTYGPGQTVSPYVGVMTYFVDALLEGRPLEIFGDGKQVRDFVHVEDVVSATVAVLDARLAQGVFNVGSGRGTSVNELARLLASRLDPTARIVHRAPRAEELRCSVAELRAVRQALGYTPRHGEVDPGEVIEALRARRWVTPSGATSPRRSSRTRSR